MLSSFLFTFHFSSPLVCWMDCFFGCECVAIDLYIILCLDYSRFFFSLPQLNESLIPFLSDLVAPGRYIVRKLLIATINKFLSIMIFVPGVADKDGDCGSMPGMADEDGGGGGVLGTADDDGEALGTAIVVGGKLGTTVRIGAMVWPGLVSHRRLRGQCSLHMLRTGGFRSPYKKIVLTASSTCTQCCHKNCTHMFEQTSFQSLQMENSYHLSLFFRSICTIK